MIFAWFLLLSVKLIDITKKAKRSSDLEATLFLNSYYRCSYSSSCGRSGAQGQLGPVEQAGWGLRQWAMRSMQSVLI